MVDHVKSSASRIMSLQVICIDVLSSSVLIASFGSSGRLYRLMLLVRQATVVVAHAWSLVLCHRNAGI